MSKFFVSNFRFFTADLSRMIAGGVVTTSTIGAVTLVYLGFTL